MQSVASRSSQSTSLEPALALAVEMLHLIPISLFTTSNISSRQDSSAPSPSEQAWHHASAFYSLEIDLGRPAEPDYPAFSGPLLFRRSLEAALRISSTTACSSESTSSAIVGSLRLVQSLLDTGGKLEVEVGEIGWDAKDWFSGVSCLLSTVRLSTSLADLRISLILCLVFAGAKLCGRQRDR